MLRRFIAGILCASALSAPSFATIGPPIAYGSGTDIYLVNPDGTGLQKVYSGARKTSITDLDVRRGGGEIAFVENKKLKVVDYDNRGVPIGSARSLTLPCATILMADYGPDGSLLVKDGCAPNHLWRIAAGATTSDPTPLVTDPNTIGDARWSRDGSKIYYESADGIRAYDVAAGSSTVIYADHSIWDVTDTGDRLLLGATNYNYLVRDLSSGTNTDGCTQAFAIHYGDNGTEMVFRRSANGGGGSYILVMASNCSGQPFRITGKAGAYVGPDWAQP